MFVSVALAFLAASTAPAEASAPVPAPATTAAPVVKQRKICRSEAVIGSITAKRVCTIVPQRDTATDQNSGQAAGRDRQSPTQESAGSGN